MKFEFGNFEGWDLVWGFGLSLTFFPLLIGEDVLRMGIWVFPFLRYQNLPRR